MVERQTANLKDVGSNPISARHLWYLFGVLDPFGCYEKSQILHARYFG